MTATATVHSPPEDAVEIGRLASNFDRIIDNDVACRLCEETAVADYTAWDFYGVVWFADALYHCAVWRYGSHVDTMSAKTPRQLIDAVSKRYGYD